MITFAGLGYQGQLGNQLFQYAMLLGIAAKRGYEVRIPHRYRGYPKAGGLVELEPLSITAAALGEAEAAGLATFHEPHFHFSPTVWEVEDQCNFTGYYQSEKYFAHIADQVRREFTFQQPIRDEAEAFILQQRIAGQPLVSIHVRRGDHLDSALQGIMRMSTMGYYQAAIGHFPGANFTVFSDDLPWSRESFLGPRFGFCELRNHWAEMCAMSLCDHHIIPCSTFGWWGAWLNPGLTKRVIVPEPWFGPKLSDRNIDDVYCAGWVRLTAS